MKISDKVYMNITYTFNKKNPHCLPQEPQSETWTSCRGRWRPLCLCRPLPLRSWSWGSPGCYEYVYWPLSQIRSTWINLKDYNQVSWEDRFPSTSGFSGWPSASLGDFVSVGARSFLTQLQKFRTLSTYFVFKNVCLYYVITEMGSFSVSVANNFCD